MEKQFLKEYQSLNRKKIFIILGLGILLLLGVHIAMFIGAFDINLSNIKDFWTDENSTINKVITRIRLPRIFASVLTGAVLSVSGVVSQSLMRNPLASPFTLGISSSAAFGASFAILFLVDKAFNRRIQITHHHADSIVLWNPWEKTPSAMKADGYRTIKE